MLTVRAIFLMALFATVLGGNAMAQSQEPPPQAPQIKTEQNPDGAASPRTNSHQDTQPADQVAPGKHQNSAIDAKQQTGEDAGKRAREDTEFWTIFGHRLKITDTLLAVFTFLLFLAGVGQGVFLYRADQATHIAADAAKQSADVAEKTLVATNRPWISVGISIGSDLTYDTQGDARVVINFVLKNVGNSPAANVQILSEIPVVFGDARPFQKAISDREKLRPAGLGNLGVTLFPGETQTHARNLPISRVSIEEFRRNMIADNGWPEDMPMAFLPTLVGCVDYKFTFAEGHHQTGFILELRKRDVANPNLALNFDVQEGAIPAHRLWLTQGFVGIPPD